MMIEWFARAVYLFVSAADPVITDAADDCNQGHDPYRQLAGCAEIIEGGRYPDYDLSIAYYNRGIAQGKLGHIEESIADYTHALDLNPDYMPAIINRGYAYIELPQYFLAFDDFNYVIEVAPGIPAAYVGRAYTELRSGGSGHEALPDLNTAISLMPSYAYAYYLRGNIYRRADDHERALADYDRALSFDPSLTYIFYDRGLMHCYAGHHDEARADFEAGFGHDPEELTSTQGRMVSLGLLGGEPSGILDAATRSAMKTWIERACP